MVRRFLDAHAQKTVADALARAKTRTSGEILLVVTLQSDHYRAAALVFSLVLTVMSALAFYLLHPVSGLPAMALLTGGLFFLFLSIAELLYLPTRFLPRGLRRRTVRRHAEEQFAAQALHTVPGRAAVLILVSLRERGVELLADEGIYTKVDADRWRIITDDLAHGLRQGERAAAIVRAIDACAALLATHFPR